MALIPEGSQDDYTQELLMLQPRGYFWPTDPNSIWIAMLKAFAATLVGADNSAFGLINEAFPDTTDQLLPNWMDTCGLPDECSTNTETEDQQRKDVLAKLIAQGGQSAAYLESVAAALGYDSTITNGSVFAAEISHADDFLFDETSWQFVFVVVTTPTPTDTAAFECRINQIKPAHTTGVFLYY